MRCSPAYHGERIDVGNRGCDNSCIHWQACLKECGLPENYQRRIWVEELAETSDILSKRFHLKNGREYRWKLIN